MKYKNIIFTFAFGIFSVLACNVYGQDVNTQQRATRDSLETVSYHEMQAQNTKDKTRMADAKFDRKQTKAKAKEAQRIERDANDAAKESKYAVRSERRAQKSRRQADKQSEKATKARNKSNSN
jgi:hypothetical protein